MSLSLASVRAQVDAHRSVPYLSPPSPPLQTRPQPLTITSPLGSPLVSATPCTITRMPRGVVPDLPRSSRDVSHAKQTTREMSWGSWSQDWHSRYVGAPGESFERDHTVWSPQQSLGRKEKDNRSGELGDHCASERRDESTEGDDLSSFTTDVALRNAGASHVALSTSTDPCPNQGFVQAGGRAVFDSRGKLNDEGGKDGGRTTSIFADFSKLSRIYACCCTCCCCCLSPRRG